MLCIDEDMTLKSKISAHYNRFSQAIRRRAEWKSVTGQTISWSIDFICLIAGFAAAVMFGPKVAIAVIIVTTVFWLWWASGYVDMNTHPLTCLVIVIMLAVNLGLLSALIGILVRHRT
jgi:hypothetical protein